jgi:hypothetical protein
VESLTIAMTIPASTKKTIAACIQIQVGDIATGPYCLASLELIAAIAASMRALTCCVAVEISA